MKPSFFSLFKRGKYYHLAPSSVSNGDESVKQDGGERLESERFAVAAVAFCLMHDKAFLKHFLDNVCRQKGDPDIEASVSIEIEEKLWADLKITNGAFTCVVEFKIGAKLEDHQNPTNPAFDKLGGYGYELREKKINRYTVLGANESLGLGDGVAQSGSPPLTKGEIICRECKWSVLSDGFYCTNNRLITDLLDCLGSLGVMVFKHRKTNNMKIESDLTNAVNAFAILQSVSEKMGFLGKSCSIDGFTDQNGIAWFGMGVNKLPAERGNSPNQRSLQDKVQTPDKYNYLGWYGYRSNNGIVGLCAYFYCSEATSEQIKKELTNKSFLVKIDEPDGEIYSVIATAPSYRSTDQDWFCSVFEAVGLKRIYGAN